MWRIVTNNSRDYIDLIHCQTDLREEEFLSYNKGGEYYLYSVLLDEGMDDLDETNLKCPKCKESLPECFKIQVKLLL